MNMHLLTLAFITIAALAEARHPIIPPFDEVGFVAPGRANRLQARAGADFGVLKFNCKGGESAYNNACYYINCHAPVHKIADADKIVYTGPNSGDNDQNRRGSGCQASPQQDGGRSVTNVCQAYPYSQKFIPSDKQSQALSWQCDEWPPASSQQQPFGFNGRIANSFRCMPGPENEELGRQLSRFYQGQGNWLGRTRAGRMARDDYARVEFNYSQADKSKLQFCYNPLGAINCGSDGYQFGLTRKELKGGKISALIAP
jgi:hypothetical protein